MKRALSSIIHYLSLSAAVILLTACQESLEEKAQREASDYTEKNCPMRLDATQIMDSMTFDKATHTFGYHYTLYGASDTIGAFNHELQRKALTERIKNTTALKAYKDEGYSFRYVYRSGKARDSIIFETTVSAEDY